MPRLEQVKGSVESIGIPIVMTVCMVFMMLGTAFTTQQFNAQLSQIQTESAAQYESYANTASLIQNESLMSELRRYTTEPSSEIKSNTREGINNAFSETRSGIRYRVSLRENTGENSKELIRVENEQADFKFSSVYVASPKKNEQILTVGVKR